ncbi:MAG: DUF5652 family protein [Minisyncoccia bacterium]
MMYHSFFTGYGLPVWFPIGGFGLLVLLVWSLFWKGLALWHSGRRGQPRWFVIMLILNTVGILEIIYLFGVAQIKWKHLFTMGPHGKHHD